MKPKKLYSLTKEHEARLPEWRDHWIANAMSTRKMDDMDQKITRDAIVGLYQAAGLEPPPPNRIIFVSSPFIAAFAAGFEIGRAHV